MSTMIEIVKSGQFPEDFAEYVDLGSGLKRVAGNQAIFIKLLKSFLNSPEPEKLRTQIENNAVADAAITAHGIKGMSGNLSLLKLYDNTVIFEGQLKQGIMDPAAAEEFFNVVTKTADYLQLLISKVE